MYQDTYAHYVTSWTTHVVCYVLVHQTRRNFLERTCLAVPWLRWLMWVTVWPWKRFWYVCCWYSLMALWLACWFHLIVFSLCVNLKALCVRSCPNINFYKHNHEKCGCEWYSLRFSRPTERRVIHKDGFKYVPLIVFANIVVTAHISGFWSTQLFFFLFLCIRLPFVKTGLDNTVKLV